MKSKTSLAYRNGQHVVLRAFTASELRETPQAVTPESFNRFILSKNLLLLMNSIDELGILSDHKLTKKDSRLFSVSEICRFIKEGKIKPVNEAQLADEIYMDAFIPYKHNASALSKMVSSYDYLLTDLTAALGDFADNDVVVVELVQDWMELRNSLSITARVLGYLLNPPEIVAGRKIPENFNGLNEAGFEKRPLERDRVRQLFIEYKFFENYESQYQIKSTHNTFYSREKGMKGIPHLLEVLEVKAPLHYSILSKDSGWTTALKTSQRINYLTAPLAKYYQQERGDTNQYLCIGECGEGWRTLAKELVVAMVEAYMEPELDQSGWFIGEGYPEVKHNQLITALWYQLIYPKDHELIICKNCGNAAITTKRGTSKTWCSDACRTYYKTHYKDEA